VNQHRKSLAFFIVPADLGAVQRNM